MISLHTKIERDFREWLAKNGEAGATFGEQGRYTVIQLTEDAKGEFADYLNEFCKAAALMVPLGSTIDAARAYSPEAYCKL